MSRLRTLSTGAKDRLPEGAIDLARRGADTVGSATAAWRMTPSFLVVGAQRCGTTTLYRLLCEHPQVVRPTASKGIGYFDLQYGRGMRWYRGHFPLVAVARRRRPGTDLRTFESSGYYCYHPLAAGRIASDLPGVKVVMMVRDPVERAWSAFKHEAARGFESEPFPRALELETERLRGEVERMQADPSYVSFEHRHHSYLGRGRYAEQVVRLRDALGEANVAIVDADRFFADTAAEFAGIIDWLGLSPWTPDRVDRWNARPGELDPGLRAELEDYFRPHDEHLAELVGRTPSWRDVSRTAED